MEHSVHQNARHKYRLHLSQTYLKMSSIKQTGTNPRDVITVYYNVSLTMKFTNSTFKIEK
jgi:hypothetical protein